MTAAGCFFFCTKVLRKSEGVVFLAKETPRMGYTTILPASSSSRSSGMATQAATEEGCCWSPRVGPEELTHAI